MTDLPADEFFQALDFGQQGMGDSMLESHGNVDVVICALMPQGGHSRHDHCSGVLQMEDN